MLHLLELGLCLIAVGGLQLDVDHAPDTDADDVEALLGERASDRLALRILDAGLGQHMHGCFH